MIRVGFGYDVHQLKESETLILGGVTIPFEKGSVGHSDGDVLCHALVDALLGAANLGDIGQYFPSDESRWEGISSLEFLRSTVNEIQSKGFEISFIDCTVILQEPKISSWIPDMRNQLNQVLRIQEDQISIKATTTDFLGFTGRGEGICAVAVATLSPGR